MIGAATATTARALPRLASSSTRSSTHHHKQSAAPASAIASSSASSSSSSSSWGFYRYYYGLAVVAAGTAATVSSIVDNQDLNPQEQQYSKSGKLQNYHHHPHNHNQKNEYCHHLLQPEKQTSWKTSSSTKASSCQKVSYPSFRSSLLPSSSLLTSILSTTYTSCEQQPQSSSTPPAEDEPPSKATTTTTTNSSFNQEEEDFLNTIGLYQHWLKEIKKQWAISSPSSIKWPTNIPHKDEISALEVDLQNYRKNSNSAAESRQSRQDLEFRIASYYLFRESSVEQQKKGFNLVKKLALECHPDGLCLYGTFGVVLLGVCVYICRMHVWVLLVCISPCCCHDSSSDFLSRTLHHTNNPINYSNDLEPWRCRRYGSPATAGSQGKQHDELAPRYYNWPRLYNAFQLLCDLPTPFHFILFHSR